MDGIVCLKVGGRDSFSPDHLAVVRLVYPAATALTATGMLGSISVIEADSCLQLCEYLRQMLRSTSARILALFRERPSSVEELSDCLSAGVTDFLFEPISPAEFHVRLRRMLHRETIESPSGASMVGESPKLKAVAVKTAQVARADVPVVILGETGSGKELVARAIHYQSHRKGYPFLPVNCGALPDHLFENELFGHTKGAFTDAKSASKGLVAEAEGGTLFLDEIDALSQQAQVKLLRFVQLGEYRPLGASRSVRANVRLVAATNADLAKCVESGRFREDLFHRLNVVNILVPSLRERAEDVPMLARHFLKRYAHESPFPSPKLGESALAALTAYSWPGNVRELEGAIRRALILADSETLEPCDFEPCRAVSSCSHDSRANLTFRKAKDLLVQQFERQYLAKLMKDHFGNVSRASRAAGTPRRCLQRLLQKHGLRRVSGSV